VAGKASIFHRPFFKEYSSLKNSSLISSLFLHATPMGLYLNSPFLLTYRTYGACDINQIPEGWHVSSNCKGK